MKRRLLFLILFSSTLCFGQFSDSFDDGDFTNDPSWSGDSDKWEVTTGKYLHLSAAEADTAFLSTVSSCVRQATWDFWLKLSFNTSVNNYARIYLLSDTEYLDGEVNGYYLQVGGSNDSVGFFRQEGLVSTRLFRCPYLFTGRSSNTFRFHITRDSTGTLEIAADSTGGRNYFSTGTVFDDRIDSSSFFGVWCKFTSSNATKFSFDDFRVWPIIHDTIPPVVASLETVGDESLRLCFSEEIDSLTVNDPTKFRFTATGISPVSSQRDPDNPFCVLLEFAVPFPDPFSDSLHITGVTDLKGNVIPDTSLFFSHYDQHSYDVLINEIMADPEPVVSSLSSEYIELYNRSDHEIRLQGWTIQVGTSIKEFPDILFPPKEYLILSSDTSYSCYGLMVRLFTSPSVLSNEGTKLVLRDQQGHVMHAISFSSDWFDNTFKQEGGWSLEMKDPLNPCGCGENWKPSENISGGTPGSKNSVFALNPDHTDPFLLRATITGSDELEVIFSEPMDSLSILSGGWQINDTVVPSDQVSSLSPFFDQIKITRGNDFLKGTIYTVKAPAAAKDCAGNRSDSTVTRIVSLPEIPDPGELIINEILADPSGEGSRFIELFNNSSKTIDLKDITLCYARDYTDSTSVTGNAVSASFFQLLSFDYAAICEDRDEVISRYAARYPERLMTMNRFPGLSGEKGTVLIGRAGDGVVLDRVDYSSEMHQPLLSSTEGVSLERVRPSGSSMDASNWHSAASSCGYATPGERNSQWWESTGEEDHFLTVDPGFFSPDNDGTDDLLHIVVRPGEAGYLATIRIFDRQGRFVKQIAGNELIAPEGIFEWNGLTEENTRAASGIYIVYAELMKTDGTVKKFKKTVVLGIRR